MRKIDFALVRICWNLRLHIQTQESKWLLKQTEADFRFLIRFLYSTEKKLNFHLHYYLKALTKPHHDHCRNLQRMKVNFINEIRSWKKNLSRGNELEHSFVLLRERKYFLLFLSLRYWNAANYYTVRVIKYTVTTIQISLPFFGMTNHWLILCYKKYMFCHK